MHIGCTQFLHQCQVWYLIAGPCTAGQVLPHLLLSPQNCGLRARARLSYHSLHPLPCARQRARHWQVFLPGSRCVGQPALVFSNKVKN